MNRLLSFCLITASASVACFAGGSPKTIGYFTLGNGATHEDSAAITWMRSDPALRAQVIDITRARLDRPGADLLWIHIPDSASWIRWRGYLASLRPLLSYYRNGGKLLFTNLAAMIPHELGMESAVPEIRPETIVNDWLFDEKGVQGFRGHPVFDGLYGGVFLWDTDTDNVAWRAGYFGNSWPAEGKVVGVEKSYVALDSDSKLLIEYDGGKGKAMAAGAFVYFGRQNAQRRHTERFVRNVIRYLLLGGKAPRTYWTQAADTPRRFETGAIRVVRAKGQELTQLPESGPRLTRSSPRNNFFDLAGRRILVMGRENGGIDEVWAHPFRVLRDFEAGLVVRDSIQWLRTFPVRVEIRPESFTRTYETPAGTLREVIYPSLTKPCAVVSYMLADPRSRTALVVRFRCDLRLMWPYDERALGDIYYADDAGRTSFQVKDASGVFWCSIGADRPAEKCLSGQFKQIRCSGMDFTGDQTDTNQVYHASLYGLGPAPGNTLTLAIVGTDEGRERCLDDFRAILSRPRDEFATLVRHYKRFLSAVVDIESPDTEFNSLWKWTLVGVDRFVTTTPGLGTALVAGFSTVDRGWDGGQKVSGRPGYAWYFGRDAEWSGFAIDDEGDFATVKRELEFLQKYQDLSGKILHELSTSGVVHYDAADATPLYVVLAAHYVRATGDIGFLKRSWPHIGSAMEFLYSTDTDGDLLIENTNVGHGWVEGGKLWPVHTEFYLAGLWAQALQDAAWMASLVGRRPEALRYAKDAATVRGRIERDFWNPSTDFYNYGKLKDGSYNIEPTVLPAPVMYFGWLRDERVQQVLTDYEGLGFTSDWGVRIVSASSPLFNPRGYHEGSVWPLFTGWTALAEYEYGRSAQAFGHVMDNLSIAKHWAYGFVQEVMNGAVYAPSGVCPHQCWSETNIVHPAIHGMIGWQPRATERAATLAPRFPLDWDSVSVRNLRVGNSVVDLVMRRTRSSTIFRLNLRHGSAVTIILAPEILEGQAITGATLDGKAVRTGGRSARGLLARPISVLLKGSSEVILRHRGGIGVEPLKMEPLPGDSSRGARITGTTLRDSAYVIELEGFPGTTARIGVQASDVVVTGVEGASVANTGNDGRLVLDLKFGPPTARVSRQRVTLKLSDYSSHPER